MAATNDTSPAMERFVIEGYRRMSPAEKLARVVALNRALDQLATARIQARYGAELEEGEVRLRLAALRLGAGLMTAVFGWDPSVRGL